MARENKPSGPIEARYFTTDTGNKGFAVKGGKVKPNTVFGKPEAAGVSYVGFLIDAAGDTPSRKPKDTVLEEGTKTPIKRGGSIFL